jgi:hypothetical protein
VTGRALPAVFLPARAMIPVGWLAGAVQRVRLWHIPAEYGAIYTCACPTRVDANASTFAPRAPGRRHRRGLVALAAPGGHLSARQAGVLGGTAIPAAAR